MIAKNYIRHPEALRFQREMFSNGYHNSPRLMRLMEVIFDWTPTIPAWWTAAKAAAKALAKQVKKSIADFFKELTVKASDQLPLMFETPKLINQSLQTATLIPWTDRAGVTVQALDAPVYMSFCNNFHPVQYAFNTYAPYWGGVSA